MPKTTLLGLGNRIIYERLVNWKRFCYTELAIRLSNCNISGYISQNTARELYENIGFAGYLHECDEGH